MDTHTTCCPLDASVCCLTVAPTYGKALLRDRPHKLCQSILRTARDALGDVGLFNSLVRLPLLRKLVRETHQATRKQNNDNNDNTADVSGRLEDTGCHSARAHAKMAHDGFKMAPRWPPDGSRWPQEGFKTAPNGFKMALGPSDGGSFL